MNKFISMMIIIALTKLTQPMALAEEFMTHEQVMKEMAENGHEKKVRVEYPKLNDVIPKATQDMIKDKKRKRKEKAKKPSKEEPKRASYSLWNLIPEAQAFGRKPEPKPTPTPTEEPGKVLSVDLRQYDTPVRSQWNGTCTAHGLIAGMENLLKQNDEDFTSMLSTRYFWSQYKRYSVYSAINAAVKNKQALDKYWPQNSSKPKVTDIATKANVQLTQVSYLEDNLDAVMEELRSHYPVYIGFAVPQDMASCRSTIRSTSKMTDGGHAVAVVGFELDETVDGGAYLILKNSWGTDCGDKGYQYMPIGMCERDDMYCIFWSLRQVAY